METSTSQVYEQVTSANRYRAVRAFVEDRVIFNFRISADDLARRLSFTGLLPQRFEKRSSVVSFCVLKLAHLRTSWLPRFCNARTIACAYRVGMVDRHGQPCVWIVGRRRSNHALVCRLAPHLFRGRMGRVAALLDKGRVKVTEIGGELVFSAEMQTPLGDHLHSSLFSTPQEFGAFIKTGVVSYASSSRSGMFTRVDLQKTETEYQPLLATVHHSQLSVAWRGSKLELDSVFRTRRSAYLWTFRGLVPCMPPTHMASGDYHLETESYSCSLNYPS